MVVCARNDRKDEDIISKFITHMLAVVKAEDTDYQ